jgi:hypothetical protein
VKKNKQKVDKENMSNSDVTSAPNSESKLSENSSQSSPLKRRALQAAPQEESSEQEKKAEQSPVKQAPSASKQEEDSEAGPSEETVSS